MLIEILHPVLGALYWAIAENVSYKERRKQVGRCWQVLWQRQWERAKVHYSLSYADALATRLAWRGYDGWSGGDVFGL